MNPEPTVSPPDFSFGDIVRDRDDDDPNEAVVVNTPPVTADEWEVPVIQQTVAEDNPEYPDDSAVVVVAFRDELEEHLPGWTDRDEPYPMDELNENNVKYYSFPAPRLTLVDQQEPGEDAGTADQEKSVKRDDLKARLDDAAWETEFTDDVLTITKLNETYHIHVDGTIDGEGHLRESLENIVAQYTE